MGYSNTFICFYVFTKLCNFTFLLRVIQVISLYNIPLPLAVTKFLPVLRKIRIKMDER